MSIPLTRLTRSTRRAFRLAAPCLAAAIAAISCGSPNKPTPTPTPTLAVTAVSPSAVASSGGTSITVTGTNFGADAKLLIDGIAVADAIVSGTTAITATAPAHAAGIANLTVTSGGVSAPFTGSFTYVAPTGANAKPVISQIRTTGPWPGQPAFANVGDAIGVVATVSDSETPVSQLTYTWTASAGTISDTLASATWTAPSSLSTSPATVTITLTVTETFTEAGLVQKQSTTSPVTVILHDTQKEILDMGEDFLTQFSLQRQTPNQILHNFSDVPQICDGRDSEKTDVEHNQATFQILSFSITRLLPVNISFGASWPPKGVRADANSRFRVHWESRGLSTGQIEIADGIDYVTGVLDGNQWWLCHSSFEGTSTNQSTGKTTKLIVR